jgi:hypothetical protein
VLDRTVDIAEVLAGEGGNPRPGSPAPQRRDGRSRGDPITPVHPSAGPPALTDAGPPVLRDVGTPVRRNAAPPEAGTPLTLESLQARWPGIVAAAKEEKPLLGSILEDTEPQAYADGALTLRVLGLSAMTAEGLRRNRVRVEELLGRLEAGTIRLAMGPQPAAPPPPPSTERLSAAGAKAERTRALREKHPALDKAVDALDLELLE